MSSAKILVVEDESIVAKDIENCLKRLSYVVPAVVDSGEEAIKKVAENQPDLVIMDIRIKGDMDGVTVAEQIRSNFQIPVIYLTAYSDEITLQRAKITEPFAYILKPFEERELQIAIEMALYKHQRERQLKEQKQRLDGIIRSIGDAVVVTDGSGCIQFMNPVAEKLTGQNQKEAFGKNLIEVLSLINKDTGEEIENPVAAVMREGVVLRKPNSCTLIARDGTEKLIGYSAAPIRDRQGNITGVVLTFQDITERKQAQERLLVSAFYDQLTQLPNRVLFLDRLRQEAKRARRRENYLFAVLFLDLDGFKAIKDRFGDEIGEQLLVAIARRLETCVRAADTVARLGGDKFAVLLEEIHQPSDATHVAGRIQAALAFPINLREHEVFTAVSIGIAVSTTGYDRPENLLRDAETAMYRAKVQGLARYAVFEGAMSKGSTASSKRTSDRLQALDPEGLQLLYQPIVSLSTGTIAAFEALVRWQHPTRGLIDSAEFMAMAETAGLIHSLEVWVLREACRQIGVFSRQFSTNPPLFISVNLSSTQLTTPGLIEQIEQILVENQLNTSRLQLEIKESVFSQDAEAITPMLQQLRNRGIRLCVKNFGSNYYLLSHLYRFPVNTLKIAPTFISRIEDEPENWEIVQTILMLAHNLNLNVIAEGVETAQQLVQLRSLSCDYGQGCFFSEPLDSEAAAALLPSAIYW